MPRRYKNKSTFDLRMMGKSRLIVYLYDYSLSLRLTKSLEVTHLFEITEVDDYNAVRS
jgi:hypothetical protein